MINVSAAFKAALENDNRNFSGSCTIALTSGKSIPIDDSQLWDNGFIINDSTSSTGGFDIGSAIVQKFTLRLNNMYDDFTEYDFTGAEISNIKVSLSLSGKTEAVSKGVFTVNDTSYDGDIITLECLDNMHKFDVNYSKSNLTYPATLLQIVQDACRGCGVTLATDSLQFEYYNYVIQKKPDDNTMTFRDVLTWVGQISGHFWKCNKSGQLSAGWYNMSDLSAGRNIHTLQTNVVTDVNVDMDDVVITCVRIVTEDENSNQVTFQSGSDGYAVVIDSNKFINKDNAAEIASMVGGRVVGLRFRPMTVSSLQDPTIEAGDGAIVYDRKLKSYKTFFTNVVFSIDADNQMSNDAESALRNSAERFSEASKIYQDLKKHLNKNKTEWEKAMEELEKAMKEQVGLYPVIKTLDDGSDGKLYINGEYIKSKTITADLIDVNTLDAIVAKIGGFVVGSTSIHTSGRNSMTSTTQGVYIGTNGFSVYKDARNYFNMNTSVGLQIKGGTIKLGNATLAEASDKKSLSVKYGMQVHTQRSSGEFTDGSGEFKLINLTTVSSGYQTLCIASNIVYKLSSSSKRYKNHVRNMDSSEADKLLKVPVVWFQYKKGYLKEGDSFEDKPVPGFYAEDVYKQYPEGVIFNEDGQIEDWNYRTMIPAMMKVIQDQNERINTLEDTVNTLNERLNKLEEMLKGVVK